MAPTELDAIRNRLATYDSAVSNPCGKTVRRVLAFADETADGEEVSYTAGTCRLVAGHGGSCNEFLTRPLFGVGSVRALLTEVERLTAALAVAREEWRREERADVVAHSRRQGLRGFAEDIIEGAHVGAAGDFDGTD